MRIKSAATLFIIVFVFVLSACSGNKAPTAIPSSAPAATPTTVPVAATATTAPSLAPTATSASTIPATETPQAESTATPTAVVQSTPAGQSGYEGDWEGQNSDSSPVSFHVENNQITSVSLTYAAESGGCSASGSYSTSVDNVPVSGKNFTIKFSDDNGKEYTFTGTLSSGTEAAGTLEVKGNSDVCGAIDAKSTWTAKNAPVTSSGDATPEATDVPAPTDVLDTTSPLDVLTGFFDQLNSSDVDAALALVDDNVTFSVGSLSGVGKEKLKAYLQTRVNAGVSYAVSDIEETGSSVKFILHTDGTASPAGADSAIIQDGKIVILKLQ